MLPDPLPILKGKEAEAFLKDAAEPPTKKQIEILKEAVRAFSK